MKTPMPVNTLPFELAPPSGPLHAWGRFWFQRVDPVGLHGFRILACLLFLVWLLPIAGHAYQFYGLSGWFDARAYVEASRLPDGPPRPISWSILFLAGNSTLLFTLLQVASLAVVVLFALGMWTRVTGILTWVVVASFRVNPLLDAPADYLMGVFAFYLALGYLLLGHSGSSLTARLLGSHVPWRRSSTTSIVANVALRLLQVHVALVIVVGGLRKLQLGDWWSGTVFWYDLFPPFQHDARSLLRLASAIPTLFFVLSAATYATLAWQIGLPLFAWQPRWRFVLLGGALIGWLGAVFVLSQPLIGPAMLVACLGFLTSTEWKRLARVAAPVFRIGQLLLFGTPGTTKAAPAALVNAEGHS